MNHGLNINTQETAVEFKGHKVRVSATEYGRVWVCARDIADLLGVGQDANLTVGVPGDHRMVLPRYDASGLTLVMYVSELGFYRLVFTHQDNDFGVEVVDWYRLQVAAPVYEATMLSVSERLKITEVMLAVMTKLEATPKGSAQREMFFHDLNHLRQKLGMRAMKLAEFEAKEG